MERAGDNCTLNTECTSFLCTGSVNNDFTVTANATYTFHPCDDPITFSTFATVSSLPNPVQDVERVNQSTTIVLSPEIVGTLGLTLEQTEDGVRFGVSVWLLHYLN